MSRRKSRNQGMSSDLITACWGDYDCLRFSARCSIRYPRWEGTRIGSAAVLDTCGGQEGARCRTSTTVHVTFLKSVHSSRSCRVGCGNGDCLRAGYSNSNSGRHRAWVVPSEIATVTSSLGNCDWKLRIGRSSCIAVEFRLDLDRVGNRSLVGDECEVQSGVNCNRVNTVNRPREFGPTAGGQSKVTSVFENSEGSRATEKGGIIFAIHYAVSWHSEGGSCDISIHY